MALDPTDNDDETRRSITFVCVCMMYNFICIGIINLYFTCQTSVRTLGRHPKQLKLEDLMSIFQVYLKSSASKSKIRWAACIDFTAVSYSMSYDHLYFMMLCSKRGFCANYCTVEIKVHILSYRQIFIFINLFGSCVFRD